MKKTKKDQLTWEIRLWYMRKCPKEWGKELLDKISKFEKIKIEETEDIHTTFARFSESATPAPALPTPLHPAPNLVTAPVIAPTPTPSPEEKPKSQPKKKEKRISLKVKKSDPTPIQEIKKRIPILYDRYEILKTELREVKTDQERYEVAKEIMQEVTPQIDDYYEKLRAYQIDKKVPFAWTPDALQAIAMMKEKESLRVRIYKLKKLVAIEKDHHNKKSYQKELETKTTRFEELKNELTKELLTNSNCK